MTQPDTAGHSWFAVRCVLHDRELAAYEERITLWQAADFDQQSRKLSRKHRITRPTSRPVNTRG